MYTIYIALFTPKCAFLPHLGKIYLGSPIHALDLQVITHQECLLQLIRKKNIPRLD